MENINQNSEKYQQAKKQVENIQGFYGNLISYIIANCFMIFINLKYSPDKLWFFWPMLGWGIGVVIHGLKTFNALPFLDKNWEERKIKKFMEQEQNSKNKWN
jgi:2TM domain